MFISSLYLLIGEPECLGSFAICFWIFSQLLDCNFLNEEVKANIHWRRNILVSKFPGLGFCPKEKVFFT